MNINQLKYFISVAEKRSFSAAAEENYIKPEDKDRLMKFRANPSDESWIKG